MRGRNRSRYLEEESDDARFHPKYHPCHRSVSNEDRMNRCASLSIDHSCTVHVMTRRSTHPIDHRVSV